MFFSKRIWLENETYGYGTPCARVCIEIRQTCFYTRVHMSGSTRVLKNLASEDHLKRCRGNRAALFYFRPSHRTGSEQISSSKTYQVPPTSEGLSQTCTDVREYRTASPNVVKYLRREKQPPQALAGVMQAQISVTCNASSYPVLLLRSITSLFLRPSTSSHWNCG